MEWRLERDASGTPCRMHWQAPCPWCSDHGIIVKHTEGARVPQVWPCPACSNPRSGAIRLPDHISPKPLEVR